jgi:carboxylate-amine ligase
MSDAYAFGIEEEYFLVDAENKALARSIPESFLAQVKERSQGRVKGEMLQAQIEAATAPHTDMAAARAELRILRHVAAELAAAHGLAILAVGTHPVATWTGVQQTQHERYDAVMEDLQMIGQRNLLCGMHVHVELPDPDARVDVMTRMLPYLPLFIALATSSPFWRSRTTGLKGYRLAAYDELPRTGVPELFRNAAEFEAYVEALVKAGVMEDSSFVWWAMRPSLRHPTLELRAPDSCTRMEDSVAIAALYRAIARFLVRHPEHNADISAVTRAIVVENKWRAQRYGVHGTFVDPAGNGAVSVGEMLDRVIEMVGPDAETLKCLAEAQYCRAIVDQGTSADAQLALLAEAEGRGLSRMEALRAVTDWIAEATLA